MIDLFSKVKFKKLVVEAIVPTRSTQYSAGLDIYALNDGMLWPGDRELVATGIAIELPPGYEGQVRSRSGLALKHGVVVLNSPGTIDEDYRGELKVILFNTSEDPFRWKEGDRIAQLIVAPVAYLGVLEVEELSSAPTRGANGFGSTGA